MSLMSSRKELKLKLFDYLLHFLSSIFYYYAAGYERGKLKHKKGDHINNISNISIMVSLRGGKMKTLSFLSAVKIKWMKWKTRSILVGNII